MSLVAAVFVAVAAGAAALAVMRAARPAAGTRRRRPARRHRAEWLRQAGVDVTPMQFALGSVAIAALTFVAVAVLTRTPLVAVPPAVALAAAPAAVVGRRRVLRLREWQAAWPDALREVLAAIVAGRSLTQAVSALGEAGPDALRPEFADFAARARVLGTVGALEHLKARMADPTSDRVIEVLIVAHERGGAIVRDVLEDLVVATSKDVKVLEEIDTEGLEMRINSRAVLVLPWFVLVALTLRPGPFREFYGSPAGLLVIGFAAGLSVLGATWLGRLGRQPAEPRVFAPEGLPATVEEQAA